MKNFIFLFITIFIIEFFPKVADATMDISIDFGPTFKQSFNFKDGDTNEAMNTSRQILMNLPSFFHEVIISGIGSTNIGVRNSGVVMNIKSEVKNSFIISMLTVLVKQRFTTITEDYRGSFQKLL